jgi:phosphotriesterase-related protein
MTTLETVTGPIGGDAVGLALPHEHVFVDLSGPEHPDYCKVDWSEVRTVCVDRLTELRRQGVDLDPVRVNVRRRLQVGGSIHGAIHRL